MIREYYSIEMPKACFRIVVENGIIVWTADYGRNFLLGRTLEEARKYGECRIFHVERIGPQKEGPVH